MKRVKRLLAEENARLVPIAVDVAARQVELLDLHGATYREPFFHETIECWRRERPAALNVTVDIESLLAAARRYQKPPDGFIFHTGRCGSTLLANMLTSSGEHLLIKEPELVSDLIADWLSTSETAAREDLEVLIAAALRCLLGAAGAATYKVLKFAAWNIRMADTLLDLFPDTPAVFVYRSPAETVASMLYQPPAWFDLIRCPRPLQARFFPTLAEVPAEASISPALLFAHAWRSAAEAALAQPSDRMLLLEYREMTSGPPDAIKRVFTHLRHPVDGARLAAIVGTRSTYSKDPTGRAAFDPGGVHRRPPLSPFEQVEVQATTGNVWSRLEARRTQGAFEYA